jgi:hypothetical protein
VDEEPDVADIDTSDLPQELRMDEYDDESDVGDDQGDNDENDGAETFSVSAPYIRLGVS